MKRLYLLRHAKAVAADTSIDDDARELAPRGHSDAGRLGKWLLKKQMRPDLVLYSPARRTVETWQDVSQAFPAKPETLSVGALYLASAPVILAQLRKAHADAQSVMAVGHNPGLEMLALYLVRKPAGDRARDQARAMAEGFPTCALAVFDFDVENWKHLDAAGGDLKTFVRPKDIRD